MVDIALLIMALRFRINLLRASADVLKFLAKLSGLEWFPLNFGKQNTSGCPNFADISNRSKYYKKKLSDYMTQTFGSRIVFF